MMFPRSNDDLGSTAFIEDGSRKATQEVDRMKTRALVDFCVLLLLFIVANPQAGGDLVVVVVAPVGGVIFECELIFE